MSKFVLTAQLRLQPPKNVNKVLNQVRNQLRGQDLDLKLDFDDNGMIKGMDLIDKKAKQSTSSLRKMANAVKQAGTRFAAFAAVGRLFSVTSGAISTAVDEAIKFEAEITKISQVTGVAVKSLKGLETTITNLSTTLGVSSTELLGIGRILSQAGIKAGELETALSTLAKTTLAPTFTDINKTVEGSVAILSQFGRGVNNLEADLGAINAVAGQFAVESDDLIDAVRRVGGVFKNAGGDLNELIALFTSVRATTRESAESIATGLRTIFTRIQRPKTIEFLKQFGVELENAEGKFVGPIAAIGELNRALQSVGEGDIRFIQIAEELGGFRQIGKVIPLIREFGTAQKALSAAQAGQNSLTKDAQTAQQTLQRELVKTREEFLALIRSLTETGSFQFIIRSTLQLAQAFIKVADALKPIIPLVTTLATIKIGAGIAGFVSGKLQGRNQGGKILGFNSGGLVPGTGNRDTVPAMLTPGEFVIRRSSVQKIGASNLAKANHYATGGEIKEITATADDLSSNFNRKRVIRAETRLKGNVKDPKVQMNSVDSFSTKLQEDFLGSKIPKGVGKDGLSYVNAGKQITPDQFEHLSVLSLEGKKSNLAGGSEPIDIPKPPDGIPTEVKRTKDKVSSGILIDKLIRSFQKQGVSNQGYQSSLTGETDSLNLKKMRVIYSDQNKEISKQDADILKLAKEAEEEATTKSKKKSKKKTKTDNNFFGGQIQYFNAGGIIRESKIGGAMLEEGSKSDTVSVGIKDVESEFSQFKGLAGGASPVSRYFDGKKFTLNRQGLDSEVESDFKAVLFDAFATGIDAATSDLSTSIGLGRATIEAASKNNFLSGIRPALIGDLFEGALRVLNNRGVFDTAEDPDRAFDFNSGLSGPVAETYDQLQGIKFVDAKSSFTAGSIANFKGKAKQQIANELKAAGIEDQPIGKKNVLQKKGFQVPDLPGFPKRKNYASGGPAGSDTVPAMLTPGEFVINRKSAQKIGYSKLNRMNKQGVMGFADGGLVPGVQYLNQGSSNAGVQSNQQGVVEVNSSHIVNAINAMASRLDRTIRVSSVNKKTRANADQMVKQADAEQKKAETKEATSSNSDLEKSQEDIIDGNEKVVKGAGKLANKLATLGFASAGVLGALEYLKTEVDATGGALSESQKFFNKVADAGQGLITSFIGITAATASVDSLFQKLGSEKGALDSIKKIASDKLGQGLLGGKEAIFTGRGKRSPDTDGSGTRSIGTRIKNFRLSKTAGNIKGAVSNAVADPKAAISNVAGKFSSLAVKAQGLVSAFTLIGGSVYSLGGAIDTFLGVTEAREEAIKSGDVEGAAAAAAKESGANMVNIIGGAIVAGLFLIFGAPIAVIGGLVFIVGKMTGVFDGLGNAIKDFVLNIPVIGGWIKYFTGAETSDVIKRRAANEASLIKHTMAIEQVTKENERYAARMKRLGQQVDEVEMASRTVNVLDSALADAGARAGDAIMRSLREDGKYQKNIETLYNDDRVIDLASKAFEKSTRFNKLVAGGMSKAEAVRTVAKDKLSKEQVVFNAIDPIMYAATGEARGYIKTSDGIRKRTREETEDMYGNRALAAKDSEGTLAALSDILNDASTKELESQLASIDGNVEKLREEQAKLSKVLESRLRQRIAADLASGKLTTEDVTAKRIIKMAQEEGIKDERLAGAAGGLTQNTARQMSQDIQNIERLNFGLREASISAESAAFNIDLFVASQVAGASKLQSAIKIVEATATKAGAKIPQKQIDQALNIFRNNLTKLGATKADVDKTVGAVQGLAQLQRSFPEAGKKLREILITQGSNVGNVKDVQERFIIELLKISNLSGTSIGKAVEAQLSKKLNSADIDNFLLDQSLSLDSLLGDITPDLLNSFAPILKQFSDSEQKLIPVLQKRIEAERSLLQVQLSNIDVIRESREIQADFGSGTFGAKEKLDLEIQKFNLQLSRTNLSGLRTGTPQEIRAVSTGIAQNFISLEQAIRDGNLAGPDEIEQDVRTDLKTAQDSLLDFTRKRITLLKEELNIVRKKNEAESKSFDALFSGDTSRFLEEQRIFSARAALQTGDAAAVSAFGADDLGKAFQQLQEQGEANTRAAELALRAQGINDPLLARRLAGESAEEKGIENEIVSLAKTMETIAEQREKTEKSVFDTANFNQVEVQKLLYNGVSLDGILKNASDRNRSSDTDQVQQSQNVDSFGKLSEAGGTVWSGMTRTLSLLGSTVKTLNAGIKRVAQGDTKGFPKQSANAGADAAATLDKFNTSLNSAADRLAVVLTPFNDAVEKLVNSSIEIKVSQTRVQLDISGGQWLQQWENSVKNSLLNEVGFQLTTKYKVDSYGNINDTGDVPRPRPVLIN